MTEISRRTMFAGATALGVGLALPAAARATAAGAAPGDAAAEALLQSIADRLIADYPENASYLGIDTGALAKLRASLTDRSAAAEKARSVWAGKTLATLEAVDRSRLSPARALDVDVAQEAFALAVAGWRFPYGDMAVLSGQNSFRNTT